MTLSRCVHVHEVYVLYTPYVSRCALGVPNVLLYPNALLILHVSKVVMEGRMHITQEKAGLEHMYMCMCMR